MDSEFIRKLQRIRDFYGKPIRISKGGGYRCERYNDSLPNSARNSQHLYGRAADCAISDSVSRFDFIAAVYAGNMRGIGVYTAHVHIDDRPYDMPERLFIGSYSKS